MSTDAPMSIDHAATDRLSTASDVAHAIRNGDLSARDVVERQLDRISWYNPLGAHQNWTTSALEK